MSKSSSTGRNLVILLLCILIAAAAYKYTMSSGSDSDAAQQAAEALKESGEDMPVTREMAEEQAAKEASDAAKAAMEAASDEDVTVNVAAALAKRALGDAEAPVTVYDYSSLTCPHCARFHNDVFPMIKENYIDTGKVYWVSHDFPLDKVAMQATVMARCAPVDAYFTIIDELFATQEDWARSKDPTLQLAQIGKDAGLSPALFDACINHEALQEELFKRMKRAGQAYQISATPSFVLNDGADKITGELPYDEFAAKIDALLTE